MSRDDQLRLADIAEATRAIVSYSDRLADQVVLDAVLFRLSVIGEAVKQLSAESRSPEPAVDWAAWARPPDVVSHQYFRVSPERVDEIVEHALPSLRAAVTRLLA